MSEVRDMDMNGSVIHSYKAYGLTIHSEILLPELIKATPDSTPDIAIKQASIPEKPFDDSEERGLIATRDEGVYFYWPDLATFLVRNGEEVLVEISEGAAPRAIRLPLLGSVLGVLLHQRGMYTLHASGVVIDGNAVAFIGEKEAGKSTMAATFTSEGHSILVDDILAIDSQSEDFRRVFPGYPQCKLWPSAVDALGKQSDELALIHPELEKRALLLHEVFARESALLRRIYVLEEGPSIKSERLSSREAFIEVVKHSYASRFLRGTPTKHKNQFEFCDKLVRHIPVYRIERPRDLSLLKDVVQHITDEVLLGETSV